MRLIDVDAMHKFVEDKVAEGKDGWANGVPYEWAYALTAADMQPTIDAEPVRHGRWIENGTDDMDAGMWHCSECGHEIYSDLSLMEEMQEQGYALYCEHCGAKMDAEEQNHEQ